MSSDIPERTIEEALEQARKQRRPRKAKFKHVPKQKPPNRKKHPELRRKRSVVKTRFVVRDSPKPE